MSLPIKYEQLIETGLRIVYVILGTYIGVEQVKDEGCAVLMYTKGGVIIDEAYEISEVNTLIIGSIYELQFVT